MIHNAIDFENSDDTEWNLFGRWLFGYAMNSIKQKYDEYVPFVDREIWSEANSNLETVVKEALEKFCDNISDN